MNRQIRNSRRLVLLVPAIAMAALAVTAAPAGADTGPVAYLTQDNSGRSAIGPVADKATPVVRSLGVTLDSVTNSTSAYSTATRTGAMSRIGPGTLRTARGDFRFSNMAVRCGSRVDEVLYGVMTLDPQGTVAPALPQQPPVNYRVPSAVPGKEILLNRQVRDATGALTVTAMTVTDKTTGRSRGYGVARCTSGTLPSALQGSGAGLPARHGSPGPVPGAAGGLGGAVGPGGASGGGALPPAAVDSIDGLLNTAQLGTLPQEPAESGWGAVLDPEKLGASDLGGAPAGQPRPTGRDQVAGQPGQPGQPTDVLGRLPGMIVGPAQGMLPASTGALLGGAQGLPLG